MTGAAHLLETDAISKYYGNIVALKEISMHVNAGEVTCILGDNGAGKSSFIKILSGSHRHDAGRLLVDGEEVHFGSPRDARAKGIATVFQDLAMVPLMSIWRNFFLGAEPQKGIGPLHWFDAATAKRIVRKELSEMGIDSAAMNVLLALPRKKRTTRAASSAPRTRCSFTASRPVRMVAELSRMIDISTPAGSDLLTWPRRFLI